MICGVCCMMLPSCLFRMCQILCGLYSCGLLLIFCSSFIFRSEAVMLLSSVFRPGTTFYIILICLITGTLRLKRSTETDILVLCVESSSLTRRPILPRKKLKLLKITVRSSAIFYRTRNTAIRINRNCRIKFSV